MGRRFGHVGIVVSLPPGNVLARGSGGAQYSGDTAVITNACKRYSLPEYVSIAWADYLIVMLRG